MNTPRTLPEPTGTPHQPLRTSEHFVEAEHTRDSGRQLAAVRDAAPAFKTWFTDSGHAAAVRTCDLLALPYPREFALWRSSVSPSPYVRIFNRMFVVQWYDEDGTLRTLLAEPTDYELAANTPFFANLARRFQRIQDRLVEMHQTVPEHLAALGISPEQVDYLTFDHLHTQDVRRWLGTTRPQPDLAGAPGNDGPGVASADEPLAGLFPRARLLVMREEWEQLAALHPLQRRWFQAHTFAELPPERIVALDSDTLLGPGVALMRTPGHTLGNHSVVLHTDSGVWTSSENGVHPECYAPERSGLPGVARLTADYGLEVVLNANTPELTATQYNNMVKEKLVADRGGPGGEWPQHFPSSELTPWRMSPGTAPSFTWGSLSHGTLHAQASR